MISYTGSNMASSLRIWEREGCELHALGVAPEGLHPVLAWQPNGRHLYAVHPHGQHHRVVLYETNGLEHGGFDVPRTGDLAHACHCKYHTCYLENKTCCPKTMPVQALRFAEACCFTVS